MTAQQFLNLNTLFDLMTCLPFYLVLHPTTSTINLEALFAFDSSARTFDLDGKPINPNPLLFPRYLRAPLFIKALSILIKER